MSKDIIIQQDGEQQSLDGVELIRTKGLNNDTIEWFPEDEAVFDGLSVIANGTYEAASANKYGYDVVTVFVQSVTGKDGDGNDINVQVDGSGNLVKAKTPSSIKVTTMPDVTTYSVGATLDFSGIEVTAYYGDGTSVAVPYSELIFPVTVAPMEPAKVKHYASSALFSDPFYCSNDFTIDNKWSVGYGGYRRTHNYYAGPVGAFFYVTSTDDYGDFLFASGEAGSYCSFLFEYLEGDKYGNEEYLQGTPTVTTYEITETYTYDGRTVYYKRLNVGSNRSAIIANGIEYAVIGNINNEGKLAWSMIYGDITTEGGYQVPVQWNRPGDGVKLETSFPITVTAITGGGGQAGDNGTGRND